MSDGMRLKTRTNIDEVFAKLDAYEDALKQRATVLALNRLGERGRVAGERQIRKTYGLTIEQLSKYMTFEPAAGNTLVFKIVASGIGFPMSLFIVGAVPREGHGPVYVKLKGRRLLIRHGFMHNGQVWARGSYGASPVGGGASNRPGQRRRRKGALSFGDRHGRDSIFEATGESFGRFAYGRNRFPITMLRSTSPPSALMNQDTIDAINERIAEQTPSAIKWAIAQVIRGG